MMSKSDRLKMAARQRDEDIILYNRVCSKVDVAVRDIQKLSYDMIYLIVREEIEIEREACAKICEERQLDIGCSHAFEAAKRIRERRNEHRKNEN